MSLKEKLDQVNKSLYKFWDTRIHFLELHYLYILLLIFISSGLYYCLPGTNWSYIDALFMATTGATDTGLNTIPMSEMKTYHMIILYISSFLGCHVTVSFVVVMVRRYYFSKRFEEVLKYNQKRKEEYRRLKLAREMQAAEEERQQRILSDTSSSTTLKSTQRSHHHHHKATSLISGPIRRRMSLISIHSTPPSQNTKRLSLFIPSKFRRGSLDTRQPEPMHHPNFNSDNEEQDGNHDFTVVQIDNLNQENDRNRNNNSNSSQIEDNISNDFELEVSSTTHPYDMSVSSAQNNNSTENYVTPSLYDSYPSSSSINNHHHQQQQQDDGTIVIVESPKESLHQSNNNQQITFSEDTNVLRERERRRFLQNRQEELELQGLHRTNSEYEIMSQPSAKSQLTRNERYRIGGTEYRALDMLARLVPMYYLGFIIIFGFLFRIYVASSSYAREVLDTSNANTGPVNYWFFSFFISLSAFTNLGLNHLDDSMSPFQNAPAPLILCIILILVGNTAFAILLRFIIWVCYILTPEHKVMRRETFRYLLDHPRRCYTTLFPATQTWWLLIVLVAITLVELICFLALNYWLPVLEGISWGSRFLDGLFQSVATRNAGFSVVNLADLNPGAQLVYIVAMYISVYPVAISMRNSNIYQERALGIFKGEDDESVKFSEEELAEAPFIKLKRHSTMTSIAQGTKRLIKGPDFFVITQIQRQLTSDICWVITGVFLICVIEAESIMSPSPVTIATVIYECVSAFGNVGASTGYPNTATSQVAQYHVLSKLVIILLMYRGRHRGLPASIDRSILLPSDELVQKEKEDEERRRNASVSLQVVNASGTSSGFQHHHHGTSDNVIYTRSCTL